MGITLHNTIPLLRATYTAQLLHTLSTDSAGSLPDKFRSSTLLKGTTVEPHLRTWPHNAHKHKIQKGFIKWQRRLSAVDQQLRMKEQLPQETPKATWDRPRNAPCQNLPHSSGMLTAVLCLQLSISPPLETTSAQTHSLPLQLPDVHISPVTQSFICAIWVTKPRIHIYQPCPWLASWTITRNTCYLR